MLRKRQNLVNVFYKQIDISYPKLRIFCQNDVKTFLDSNFYLPKMLSFNLEIIGTCNKVQDEH